MRWEKNFKHSSHRSLDTSQLARHRSGNSLKPSWHEKQLEIEFKMQCVRALPSCDVPTFECRITTSLHLSCFVFLPESALRAKSYKTFIVFFTLSYFPRMFVALNVGILSERFNDRAQHSLIICQNSVDRLMRYLVSIVSSVYCYWNIIWTSNRRGYLSPPLKHGKVVAKIKINCFCHFLAGKFLKCFCMYSDSSDVWNARFKILCCSSS